MISRPSSREREIARGRRGERGMTLVEILVVITILGIIGTVLAVNVFSQLAKSKHDLAKIGVGQLAEAVNLYKMNHSKLPETLDDLLHPPEGAKSYINGRDALLDPWKRLYEYRQLENGDAEIVSLGADGQPGGTGEAADVSNVQADENR